MFYLSPSPRRFHVRPNPGLPSCPWSAGTTRASITSSRNRLHLARFDLIRPHHLDLFSARAALVEDMLVPLRDELAGEFKPDHTLAETEDLAVIRLDEAFDGERVAGVSDVQERGNAREDARTQRDDRWRWRYVFASGVERRIGGSDELAGPTADSLRG